MLPVDPRMRANQLSDHLGNPESAARHRERVSVVSGREKDLGATCRDNVISQKKLQQQPIHQELIVAGETDVHVVFLRRCFRQEPWCFVPHFATICIVFATIVKSRAHKLPYPESGAHCMLTNMSRDKLPISTRRRNKENTFLAQHTLELKAVRSEKESATRKVSQAHVLFLEETGRCTKNALAHFRRYLREKGITRPRRLDDTLPYLCHLIDSRRSYHHSIILLF